MPRVELLNGDCLELISQLQDESIDLIFADLPFYQGDQPEIADVKYDKMTKQQKKVENYNIWNSKLAVEMNRVLKNGGNIVLVNAPRYILSTIHHYLEYFDIRNTIPLIRRGSLRPAWMLGFQHNLMVFLVKGDKKLIWGGAKTNHDKSYPTDVWDDVQYQNGFRGKGGDWHPEAINLQVVKRAVELNTITGSTVLDVTMGSGTTGVACIELGLDFIGFEVNEKYYNIATRRINSAMDSCNRLDL